ncbi:MAG: hypothetical protein H6918_05095 [Sphingomonadaceae bacterium]|nr:hypothetical protein [Sphingomonadaceae bacterium]
MNNFCLKLFPLACAVPLVGLAACGSSGQPSSASEAPTVEEAIPAAMQQQIAEGRATLESNLGSSDAEILQAGLPLELPITPDGKVVSRSANGASAEYETAFSPSLVAAIYQGAARDGEFTASPLKQEGAIGVEGVKDGKSFRILASKKGKMTRVAIVQLPD